MRSLLIIAGAVLAYLGFQTKAKVKAAPVYSSTAEWDQEPVSFEGGFSMSLDELYQKHGRVQGLDWKLLKAIAQVESNENPAAKNQADPSFGLMQILCQDDGMGSCRNKLNILDWPPENKSELFDPDYSLHIGAQILAWNIGQYGRNKGIAVYNAWKAHTAPNDGPFPNQGYVDKVLGKYRVLGGI